MLIKNYRRSSTCFFAGILFLTVMLLGNPSLVAAGGGLPPRLPPRPVEPTPPAPPPITGAMIQLQTSTAMPGAWTVVEWQNEHGDWYVVTGWQGHLDDGNDDMKSWWVYPDDFNSAPFRWQVYESETGALLATSENFHLPAKNLEIIIVEVDLP